MTARWIVGLLFAAAVCGCVEVLRRWDDSVVAREIRAERQQVQR